MPRASQPNREEKRSGGAWGSAGMFWKWHRGVWSGTVAGVRMGLAPALGRVVLQETLV